MAPRQDDRQSGRGVSPLEWAASGLGLCLTLGLLAILGWQAWREPSEQLPAVTVSIVEVRETGGLHVVAVEARNSSPATAANVIVSGTLRQGGPTVEQSQFTLDYVPGGSSRRGGLFFTTDPTALDLEVRALGYADP